LGLCVSVGGAQHAAAETRSPGRPSVAAGRTPCGVAAVPGRLAGSLRRGCKCRRSSNAILFLAHTAASASGAAPWCCPWPPRTHSACGIVCQCWYLGAVTLPPHVSAFTGRLWPVHRRQARLRVLPLLLSSLLHSGCFSESTVVMRACVCTPAAADGGAQARSSTCIASDPPLRHQGRLVQLA
jgi:hypothetical protein